MTAPAPLLLLLLLGSGGCLAGADANANADRIHFMSPEEARMAIVDESVEPYFSRLQPLEMAAKTGAEVHGKTLAESRDICRQRYRDAVQAFTPTEEKTIRELLVALAPLVAHYTLYDSQPWSFIKISGEMEGGMPHTRGRSIVLCSQEMAHYASRNGHVNIRAVSTLAHEQMHVIQRLHPAPFAVLYTSVWGFVRMPHAPTQTPAQLVHQLVNPDGIDAVWAFPIFTGPSVQWVQPQVIIGSDAAVPHMPDDFLECAYSLIKDGDEYRYRLDAQGQPVSQPLNDLATYTHAFSPADEIFHPNETCANLFALMIAHDLSHNPSDDPDSIKGLRRWAAANLQVAPVRTP